MHSCVLMCTDLCVLIYIHLLLKFFSPPSELSCTHPILESGLEDQQKINKNQERAFQSF